MNLKEEQPSQAKLGLRLKDSVEYLIFVPCLVDVVCYAYGTVVVYVSGLGKYVTRAHIQSIHIYCHMIISPFFVVCRQNWIWQQTHRESEVGKCVSLVVILSFKEKLCIIL